MTSAAANPGAGGPVLLVVAGGAVSCAAIARTAELAAGAPVTVVGVGASDLSRTDPAYYRPAGATSPAGEARRRVPPPRPRPAAGLGAVPPRACSEPEQVRRTVALAMSVLEDTGVIASGHIAVTGSPARAVARVARACGARVVILDQPGPACGAHPARPGVRLSAEGRSTGTAGLMAELRRRMYGSGVVVLAETDRRGGWVSA